MNKAQWIQWLAATAVAGVTGVFALIAYIQASTISPERFSDHQRTVHEGAVSQGTYLEDLRDLRKRMENQNAKLDRIIELMVEGK